jgi:hypothetical protein
MVKILRLTCLALAASAALLIAPGGASAALYSGSTLLPVGSEVVGIPNTGNIQFKAGGETQFECTSSKFNAVINKNGLTGSSRLTVNSFTFNGVGSEGKCAAPWGATRVTMDTPACFKTVEEKALWEETGASCTEPSKLVGITLESAFTGKCHYSSSLLFNVLGNEPLQIRSQERTMTKDGDSHTGLCLTSIAMVGTWNVTTASGGSMRYTY